MDAIQYLRAEHTRFKKALKEIANLSKLEAKQRKFDKFCQDLTRHEHMEEKLFYPILKKTHELKDIIKHLVSEEKSAAQAIKKFKKVQFDFMWKLRFIKFKHDVEHHAKEEEKELFRKVRQMIDKSLLIQIGKLMKKYKDT